jgi:GxxExxY protein
MKRRDAEDAKGTHEAVSGTVIGSAIDVHRALGPGLLESAYLACLARELELRGVSFQAQVPVPLIYKGVHLHCGYRLDLLVENMLVVELKAVEQIHPIHFVQVLTYLRLTRHRLGLLINFNVPILRLGIRRIANRL